MALVAKAKEFVKKHPYLTGGLVLGVGFLLYMLSSSGGGGGGSAAADQSQEDQLEAALAAQSTQLQEAQLQANEQLSADQLSAQVQESQIGGQLSQDQIAASLQTALEQLQVGGAETVNSQNTSAQTTLGLYSVLGGLGSALIGNIKSIGQLFTGTPASVTVTGGSSGLFGGSSSGGLNLSSLFGGSTTAATSTPLAAAEGDVSGADIGSIQGFGSDLSLPSFSTAGQVADIGSADIGTDIGGDFGDAFA